MVGKVIIRGHVFDYAEKAPFVESGMSILGAVEYDEEADKLRCHECGEWYPGLSNHVFNKHRLKLNVYRSRHGLNQNSSLNSKQVRAARSDPAKLRWQSNPIRNSLSREAMVSNGKKGGAAPLRKTELANVLGRCQVQTLFRLQVLAAQLKHTPTANEIDQSGIGSSRLIAHFGSIKEGQEAAGLIPNSNRVGPMDASPLPIGFPTKKQLDDTRMPWPKEYFGVRSLERKHA